MAQKKEKIITKVEERTPSERPAKYVEASKSDSGFRIGAIVLWVLAIVCEILAVLVLFGKIRMNFMPEMWQLIAFIVLDLVFLIIGSQLWKRANHIKPASKQNPTKFWLWNNMGVIVGCFAFVPLIILMLLNKDLDKKTKLIAVIVAVIALLIGGAASADWNPVSSEELAAAEQAFGTQTVYWTQFGKVYHTHTDCQSLNQSEQLFEGSVNAAIEHSKTRLCKFCARTDQITDVVIEEQ